MAATCRVLTAVLTNKAAREDFAREHGIEAICQMLASLGGHCRQSESRHHASARPV